MAGIVYSRARPSRQFSTHGLRPSGSTVAGMRARRWTPMPENTWEPPPAERDREDRARDAETDQPRNLDTAAQSSDLNSDIHYDDPSGDDINLNGSER